jgi:hypothetical protein
MKRLLPRAQILRPKHGSLWQPVAVGRVALQPLSSILHAIKRFKQRNASTFLVATFAVTLVSATVVWIWMLVGATKWALGF